MISVPARVPVDVVPISRARATLPALVAAVREAGARGAPVFIGRHGEPVAVLMSLEHFHDYCVLLEMRRRSVPGRPIARR